MKKGLSPDEIRAEMMRRGILVKDIAKKCGVTPGAVTQTIRQNSKRRYKGFQIRPVIAEVLGMREEDIWPH